MGLLCRNRLYRNFSIKSIPFSKIFLLFSEGTNRAVPNGVTIPSQPRARCQRRLAAVKGYFSQILLSKFVAVGRCEKCTICRNNGFQIMLTSSAYPHSFHTPPRLWITVVDNYVENVENYEFSTVISLPEFSPGLVKSLHTPLHKPASPGNNHQVTATVGKGEFPKKNGALVTICRPLTPSQSPVLGMCWGNFCELFTNCNFVRLRLSYVRRMKCRLWEIMSMVTNQ